MRVRTREESNQLFLLAAAGADMAREPDRVPAIAVRAAMALGCAGVSFRVLDDRRVTIDPSSPPASPTTPEKRPGAYAPHHGRA